MAQKASGTLNEPGAETAAFFNGRPETLRASLFELRERIFATAARIGGIGPVHETLKWGQASYLTKSGSTIRVDTVRGEPNQYALYVHCRTDLIETFRKLYPATFTFDGNRALRFKVGETLPTTELEHCIALALTYHSRKKASLKV